MKRRQDIIGIQISDLIITCKFRENYAKSMSQFINSCFSYDDFEVEINGITKIITLQSDCDIQISFNKKSIKNKTEVTIFSLKFEDIIIDSYYNYSGFLEMLKRFKSKLCCNELMILEDSENEDSENENSEKEMSDEILEALDDSEEFFEDDQD